MKKIISHFEKAKALKKQASECSAFSPAKKMQLAEAATDELEITVGLMIEKLGGLDSANR